MPPIEVGMPRAIGAVTADVTRRVSSDTAGASTGTIKSAASASARPAIATSEALDPGEAPVDIDRVAVIRKAVETGNYPLVPARIADAMIAAGMILRSGKA